MKHTGGRRLITGGRRRTSAKKKEPRFARENQASLGAKSEKTGEERTLLAICVREKSVVGCEIWRDGEEGNLPTICAREMRVDGCEIWSDGEEDASEPYHLLRLLLSRENK